MRRLRTVLLAALFPVPAGLLPQRAVSAQGTPEPPVAFDDYARTDSTMNVTVDILANDSGASAPIDPTTVQILQAPATGTATVHPRTGEIRFTPDPGAAVVDYLLYEVDDRDGRASNPAFLWLDVLHDPPTGFGDSASTLHNENVVIDVLSNDFGGTALIDAGTVTIVTRPADASVSVDGTTGEVTYTPNNLFSGSDSFEYVVADSWGVKSPPVRVDVDVVTVPPGPPGPGGG